MMDTSCGKIQILPNHIDVIAYVCGQLYIQYEKSETITLTVPDGIFMVKDKEWTLLCHNASVQS
jgi:F0F1-type ATP synthase epsilon subunit